MRQNRIAEKLAMADWMSGDPSNAGFAEGAVLPSAWTHELTENRLIEAAALWGRTPREGGGSRYASDGPWHLMLREWEDWGAHEEKPLRRAQLSREDVARRDEATAWVQAHVEREEDRRIVWLALYSKADGRRPNWRWIKSRVAVKGGPDTMRMRYVRAVAAIAMGLNAAKIPVVQAWI